MAPWMIYGAYGETGRLIAERAVQRGHAPVLAGRDASKLQRVADDLSLEARAVALHDARELAAALSSVDLVLHAAGPFVHTAEAMMDACLATGTHYADITGEVAVLEDAFRRDEAARGAGIAIMSGVGFDVVPTDCLARYVADRVEGVTDLEIAFEMVGAPSVGTALTALDRLRHGGLARRDGRLVRRPLCRERRTQRLTSGERLIVDIPWGDLVTAWHTTGSPNITIYMALPEARRGLLRWAGLARLILQLPPARALARRLVRRRAQLPDAAERAAGRSHFWARARGASGQAEAWLDGPEGYDLTAAAAVRCVERILDESPTGAQTPAGAFGADLILEVEGTRRFQREAEIRRLPSGGA